MHFEKIFPHQLVVGFEVVSFGDVGDPSLEADVAEILFIVFSQVSRVQSLETNPHMLSGMAVTVTDREVQGVLRVQCHRRADHFIGSFKVKALIDTL